MSPLTGLDFGVEDGFELRPFAREFRELEMAAVAEAKAQFDTSSGCATWTRSPPLTRPRGPSALPNSFRRFPNGSSLPGRGGEGIRGVAARRSARQSRGGERGISGGRVGASQVGFASCAVEARLAIDSRQSVKFVSAASRPWHFGFRAFKS